MTDLTAIYHSTRHRLSALASTLDDEALATTVPACPDWSVHDLVAHVAGMAVELAAGNAPTGDFEGWIHAVLDTHRDRPVDELVADWTRSETGLAPIMDMAKGLLAPDVVTHEHDIRGALGRPGERDHPDLVGVVGTTVAMVAPILTKRGLGAIEVLTPSGVHRSHDDEPGWTIRCSDWEAMRIFESRRTAAELATLDSDCAGDVADYISALDRRQPLPATSLGEI